MEADSPAFPERQARTDHATPAAENRPPEGSAPLPDATDDPSSAVAVRQLSKALARYRDPDHVRSVAAIIMSAAPFAALWAAMWLALTFVGYWLALLLALPAAGFLVRLFLIQHDCGHGSMFRGRAANDWIGRVLGVITLTPYDHWRRTHALHHAGSGHLDWASTMGTNAAIAAAVVGLAWAVGFGTFLMIHLPIIFLGAGAGVWLFYIQHQFETTHWDRGQEWEHHEAALHGSSYYDLPALLRWFSANVGIHHVHHLSSRIPHYRLPEVLRDHPELRGINRLTLRQSLRCVRLSLWDEDARRLVSFRSR